MSKSFKSSKFEYESPLEIIKVSRTSKVGLATVLVLALAVIANAEPNQADGAIARPASRAATGFVPRLGKRFDQRAAATLERMTLLEALLRRISTQNGYNPRVYASPSPPMPALYSEGQFSEQLPGSQNEQPLDEMLELLVPRRETRASEGSDELIGGLESAMSSSSSGSKRVAFTPRIGR